MFVCLDDLQYVPSYPHKGGQPLLRGLVLPESPIPLFCVFKACRTMGNRSFAALQRPFLNPNIDSLLCIVAMQLKFR